MPRTICEQCGKWAIHQLTGIVFPTFPAQYETEYRCACGWNKKAEVERGETREESFKRNWENAQK